MLLLCFGCCVRVCVTLCRRVPLPLTAVLRPLLLFRFLLTCCGHFTLSDLGFLLRALGLRYDSIVL